MGAAAGWLADPTGAHELRYWSGEAWTEHVSDAGTAGVDALPADAVPPPPPAVVPPPPPPPAPEASRGGGGWKDRLKSAAQQAATQGRALADQAKDKLGEQQAKRAEQWANDPSTLWYGTSKTLATGAVGVSKAAYRITADRIWIDTGLLGVRSESVPLWAVRDLDVRQNLLQRDKDVGDVVLHLEDPGYAVDPSGMFDLSGETEFGTTSGEVVLDNIEGPYRVRDLLMPLVGEARAAKLVERRTQHLHIHPGAAGFAGPVGGSGDGSPAAPAANPGDLAEQLRELAALRDEGILSAEEFAAQKARLLGT